MVASGAAVNVFIKGSSPGFGEGKVQDLQGDIGRNGSGRGEQDKKSRRKGPADDRTPS
jgi:hypothetical protein